MCLNRKLLKKLSTDVQGLFRTQESERPAAFGLELETWRQLETIRYYEDGGRTFWEKTDLNKQNKTKLTLVGMWVYCCKKWSMDKFKTVKVFLIKLYHTFRIQIENSYLSLGSSTKGIMTPNTFHNKMEAI